MKEADAVYLACLLETEGTLAIHRHYKKAYRPHHQAIVSVGMTDREPIEFAAKVWGSKVSKYPSPKGKYPRFITLCPSKKIVKILQVVHPHLKTWRRKMKVLLMIGLRNTGQYNRGGVPEDVFMFREALFNASEAIKEIRT